MDVPIQVGCAVYDLAKLRMLQFYYDFIDKYIDSSDFIYCQMDTDSAYIAFSGENFENLIKPELKEHYLLNKNNGFHLMIQKKTLNLIRALLDYLKRNTEVNLL